MSSSSSPISGRQRPDSQRVVVTGVGLITPVGNTVPESWDAILRGQSGAGPITLFDPTQFRTQFAAEVKGFDPTVAMDRRDARRMDRFSQFGLVAAKQAYDDAAFGSAGYDPARVGVIVGSGIGGIQTIFEQWSVLRERGPRRVSPFTVPSLMLNSAAAHISIGLGTRGPCLAIATACATGGHALGEAADMIRRGMADAMFVGSSEAAICELSMAGFDNMGALSTRNEAPERASRPFDAGRDGFVMGEGAGMLVLERFDQARARGVSMYAEMAGYATNSEAFHITAPAEDGSGFAGCMQMALEDAGLRPEEVDYVNAHGTSTPLNDGIETLALKTVFGAYAYKLAISSTKSMTGHLMGAAGAIEGVFSVLTIRDQMLPPTMNYEVMDPACDLDYIPNKARAAKVDVVMSNSFGFGGHNATVILRRLPGNGGRGNSTGGA